MTLFDLPTAGRHRPVLRRVEKTRVTASRACGSRECHERQGRSSFSCLGASQMLRECTECCHSALLRHLGSYSTANHATDLLGQQRRKATRDRATQPASNVYTSGQRRRGSRECPSVSAAREAATCARSMAGSRGSCDIMCSTSASLACEPLLSRLTV